MIYHVVSFIPRGKVLTYGQIGRVLKINPRQVGYWLHRNPSPRQIPCHRVVFSDGQLSPAYAFGGSKAQRDKLLAEGVVFSGQKVNLQISRFKLNPALRAYLALRQQFGPPGPWPWFGGKEHRAEEIAIGAVLAQATNWRNAELALEELRRRNLNSLSAIARLPEKSIPRLGEIIRSSGFFRQKAERLWRLAQIKKLNAALSREELLRIKGIGPETADTILLYALGRPVFVIDEYTKRFVKKCRLTAVKSYAALQGFFTGRLPVSVKLYQDFHALIVRWGKER